MFKYITKTLICAYVVISFLLIGKVLISESEIFIKILYLLIILSLFLISLGSYNSWRHMKQIAEHRSRVNIFLAIHLISYLLIAHFYYYTVLVLTIENIYLRYYIENVAIYIILATNFMPMLYLENLKFKYFQCNGKTFIEREKPLN